MKTLNREIDTDVVAAESEVAPGEGTGRAFFLEERRLRTGREHPGMLAREDLPVIRLGLQALLRVNRGDRQRMRRIEDVMGYLLELEAEIGHRGETRKLAA